MPSYTSTNNTDVFSGEPYIRFAAKTTTITDQYVKALPQTATSGTASTDVAQAWSYKTQTEGKGSLYIQGTYGDVKLLAGGGWPYGTNCGSRARYADVSRWNANVIFGFRGVARSTVR